MAEVKITILGEDKASPALGKLNSALDRCKSTAIEFTKGLIAFQGISQIASGIKSLAGGLLDVASANEQYIATLRTLLGSQEAANRKFAEMNEFARKTPFQIDELMRSFTMMKSYGLDPSINTMRTLGDATAALGGGADKLQGIARALGQIATKGKVSAQELMQLAEQGVPAYDILREKLGLTADQLENMGKSGVSAGTAISAILEGMSERFGGQMQNMQATFKGIWEEMKSLWRDFMSAIADAGAFDKLKAFIADMRDHMASAFASGKAAEWAGKISSAIESAITVFGMLGTAIKGVIYFMKGLAVALATLGLSALLYETYTIIGAINKFRIALISLATTARTTGIALKMALGGIVLGAIIVAMELLIEKIYGVDKAVEQLNRDLAASNEKLEEKFQRGYGDLGYSSIAAFTEAFQAGEVAFDKIRQKWINIAEEAKKSADAITTAYKEHYETIVNLQATAIEKMKAKQQELLDLDKQMMKSQMTTEDLILGVRQKGMTAEEKYQSQISRLTEKQAMAMTLGFEDKISMLESVQQAWAGLSDEVREGESVVVSAATAQATAIQRITDLGGAIKAAQDERMTALAAEIETWQKVKDEAEQMLDAIKNKISEIDKDIKIKVDVDAAGALSRLGEIQDSLSRIGGGAAPSGGMAPGPIASTGIATSSSQQIDNSATNVTINAPSGDAQSLAQEVEKVLQKRAATGRNVFALTPGNPYTYRNGAWTNA